MLSQIAFDIFQKSIEDYHKYDSIDNSFNSIDNYSGFEQLLYQKNWIDTIQWHCEDIVRDPLIDPSYGMTLKRRIDHLNQTRTNLVEKMDDYFIEMYQNVSLKDGYKFNTESPAWAIDRLSILALKIYHMNEELKRSDSTPTYQTQCSEKLEILICQKKDLIHSIQDLLDNIAQGTIQLKVYRQMKMYNDDEMNPILRKNK